MKNVKILPGFITAFTFIFLGTPAAWCADDYETTDAKINNLIKEVEMMEKNHQPLSEDFRKRAGETAQDLKSRADTKARDSQMAIEALERGEAPPMPAGKIPEQLFDEDLNNAEELMRAGKYSAAKTIAEGVLEQVPDSQRAKDIIQKSGGNY